MKVTIIFEDDDQDDGFSGSTSIVRKNLETDFDLLYVFGEAARAAGFSYVDRVGYSTNRGVIKWGHF